MPGSLKCPERRVDGRICGKSFTTAWNLKRHMSGFHQAKPIFFIDCNSEASGEQSRARLDRLQFAPLRVQRWVSPATSSATGSSPQAVSTQSSSLLSPTSRSDCSSSRPSTTSSNRVRLAGLTLETRARELSAPDLSQEIFTPCNTPKTRFWNPIATQRGFEASSYNNLRPWEESSFDASRTSPPSDSAQVRQQVAGNDIKTPTPFEFGRAASHEFALEQRWPEIYRGASDEFTSSKSSASFESNSTPTPTYHLAQTSTNVSSSGKRPYTASDSGRVTPSPNGESEAIDNINPAPPKKPRWSDVIPHFGRSVRAGLKQPVPRYEVKLAKNLQQTHAVDWLTAMGKMAFEEKYMSLLSAWGVKPGHQGTCILCPEEWRLADPMDLFECLEKNNMPNALEQRATYSYAGHGTTLARALSWFVEWPRRGIELDNFLGFGPYQEVDGSHRCHQGFCIVHLVLEGTPTNHDRGKCREHAVTLRRLAKEIPEQCLEHDPPCLLQHAALTTKEAYHIQFAVLRQARGLPPIQLKPHKRRYMFPTFESGLPCSFPAIAPDPTMLDTAPVKSSDTTRPKLMCSYCTRFKPFASIHAFWVHIVGRHEDVPNETRLQTIRESANLWRQYWSTQSGGKRGNRTLERLDQIEEEGFCWRHVEEWQLH